MPRPTLSVTLPNYNHASYIGEALESILGQSRRPDEVIVVDDGSSDHSVEIIQRFALRYPEIRFFRNEKNMGPMFTINKAVALASGDYLHHAAADDRILPGFYEKSMELLRRHPGAGVCSALMIEINEEGAGLGVLAVPIVSKQPCFFPPGQVKKLLLSHGTWIQGLTVIHRRDALLQAGGFDPRLGSYCDTFHYEVTALKYGACFLPEVLAAWRRSDAGYAGSTMRSASRTREIVEYAVQLMESPRYAGLFPFGYARQFERRYLFWFGQKALERMARYETQTLDLLRLAMPQATPLDGFFISCHKLFLTASTMAATSYLLIRNFNIPLVRLILSWLVNRGWRKGDRA